MVNLKKPIILAFSCILTLLCHNQAYSMNYVKSACKKVQTCILNQWHGKTAEELQLFDADIHPEILNQEKMQEILLFRHIKKELKRVKRDLASNPEESNDEQEEDDGHIDVDATTIWNSFFEFTLPNLEKLSKREKDTISTYFCTCKNDQEHAGCNKTMPDKKIKNTLELVDYLITIIKQQLTPGRRYTQKELDNCKDAQDLLIRINTKYPNAGIKGKLKICIAMLSTFCFARAAIYYKLYGLSLTALKSTAMQTLWCIPNVATGMYLPLLIPVLCVMLKRL